ncbi:MAG: polysulfide reductase NrfD [Chloroflexi bacterium]|nr:polysulfide reductase NrfD [Chloroflexota bacterium]
MGLEQVYWTLPIVAYPFISGLIAGSFIVGTLSRVFRARQYEPLAKLSLLITLAFLLFAAVGPEADAQQPSRWWELFVRPHIPAAPMGLFTLIWVTYLIVVLIEIFLAFRPAHVQLAAVTPGWRGGLYRLFAGGMRDLSAARLRRDNRLLTGLAIFGIVLAFAFHGYIGFIFGAIKARPLWSSPLMMPLFIVSAILSGIALMIVAYTVISRLLSATGKVDRGIVAGLSWLMMWVILVDLFLDLVELLNTAPSSYSSLSVNEGFTSIFLGNLPQAVFGYWIGQLGLLVVALLLTWIPRVRRSPLWASITALIALVSVWFMRFNTVIGGQIQPKVSQGLILYTPTVLGRGSIQVVFGLFMLIAFVLLALLFLLPWDDEATAQRLTLAQQSRGSSTTVLASEEGKP